VTVVLLGRTELTDEPAELESAADEHQLRRALSSIARRHGLAAGPAAIAEQASHVLAVREIRSTIAGVKAVGAHAEYRDVDIRNADAVRETLRMVSEQSGAVTGIVHGAGVVQDRYLIDKSNEQFAAVFDTKVRGLRNLLDAVDLDRIQSLFVFSSVTARFGNVGQSDYAMANEVLGQVAGSVAARNPDCIVRSIDWGPWDGGMVDPGLREHFLSKGAQLVPLDAGSDAFAHELDWGPGPVRIGIIAAGGDGSVSRRTTSDVMGTVHVDASTHAYLADHVPVDKPVVPMTVVLEWILSAARAWRPASQTFTVTDLDVVRGVELEHFGTGSHDLHIVSKHSVDGLALEVRSARHGRHYEATVAAGGDVRRWSAGSAGSAGLADPYRSPVLFHGPRFRALSRIDRLDSDGGCAQVTGVDAMDWQSEALHSDPLAIDAGLQLALLWAEHVEGAAFLPMAVAAATVSMSGPVGPGARVVVESRGHDDLTAQCDVAVLDGEGSVVTQLMGVSLVRRTDRHAEAMRVTSAAGHRGE
jgi:NADP-dependent 3-hydroxy acid dehydrogenase YdfG